MNDFLVNKGLIRMRRKIFQLNVMVNMGLTLWDVLN